MNLVASECLFIPTDTFAIQDSTAVPVETTPPENPVEKPLEMKMLIINHDASTRRTVSLSFIDPSIEGPHSKRCKSTRSTLSCFARSRGKSFPVALEYLANSQPLRKHRGVSSIISQHSSKSMMFT